MTINYSVEVNKAAIAEVVELFEFVGGNSEDALRIAINRAGAKILTLSNRKIRDRVRLSASYVRGKLVFKRATRKKLTGAIQTPTRGLLLSRYSTDPTVAGSETGSVGKAPKAPAGGIKVKVKTDGAAKVLQGNSLTAPNKPFYMVLRNSGALGLVARMQESGARGGKIKAFYGPSISQVFGSVRTEVLPDASAELQLQLLDAMRYLINKKYPPEPTE